MERPFVIGIVAVSGGGKTTIIDELKGRLNSSKTLYFDDYSFEGEVDDFYEWTKDGADYNVWNLEPLKVDIEKLLKETDLEYILLDYPFAYKNEQIRPYIDFSIFIDTPLDIAMARRFLRDYRDASTKIICADLEQYLNGSRIAYIEMLRTIRPNSDFIVNSTLPITKVVDQIIEKLMNL